MKNIFLSIIFIVASFWSSFAFGVLKVTGEPHPTNLPFDSDLDRKPNVLGNDVSNGPYPYMIYARVSIYYIYLIFSIKIKLMFSLILLQYMDIHFDNGPCTNGCAPLLNLAKSIYF